MILKSLVDCPLIRWRVATNRFKLPRFDRPDVGQLKNDRCQSVSKDRKYNRPAGQRSKTTMIEHGTITAIARGGRHDFLARRSGRVCSWAQTDLKVK